MRSVVLLKLLLFISFALCENENVSQQGDFNYIFTYPQSMISGRTAKACLTLSNAKLPARLAVRFKPGKCGHNNQEICESSYEVTKEYQCFELNVPKRNKTNKKERDSFEIELESNGQKVKQSGSDDIFIFSSGPLLSIETDKRRYKPNDLVRIRILALEYDMTPAIGYTISKLTLLNANGGKAKQWENIRTINGLAQLDYQLQDNSTTGEWWMEIDERTHTSTDFLVEQYVLPRFETTLEHPSSFKIYDKMVKIKVCAKYSCGKNVKGTGVIKVKGSGSNARDVTPVTKSEELKDGCVTLNLEVKDLTLNKSELYGLTVTGSVTEQGTNETQIAQGNMHTTIGHQYQFDDYSFNTKLKYGLPYRGNLETKSLKVNLNGKKAKLCYQYFAHTAENITIEDCQDILIDNRERIPFTIPPLKKLSQRQLVIDLSLPRDATVKDSYYKSFIITPSTYSASNNSLQVVLDDEEKVKHCEDDVSFTVSYTLNNITDDKLVFNYLLMSRYDVVESGHVDVKPTGQLFNPSNYENVFEGENNITESGVPIGEFKIKLKLNENIYTNAKLVVFYMTNGEVIADNVFVKIEDCLPNKVEIKWNKDTLEPAEKAALKISTAENSLCFLTGVDKASAFKSRLNLFSIEKILGPSEYRRDPYYEKWPKSKCIMTKDAIEEEAEVDSYLDADILTPYFKDAGSIFHDMNVGVISNQKLVTRPCAHPFSHHHPMKREGPILTGDKTPGYSKGNEKFLTRRAISEGAHFPLRYATVFNNRNDGSNTEARTYFSETFLWDLIPVHDGNAVLQKELPDSITTLVTQALCISKTKGVGLSSTLEVNVFKPFFIDALMPDSIKRNTEIVNLSVIAFNYFNYSIPVRITLGFDGGLQMADRGDKKTVMLCMEADSSATHIYMIKALKLGTFNVSIFADLDPDAFESCGNAKAVVKPDLIYKTIKVEPEGHPSHIVKGALLCGDDSLGADQVSWEISLPELVVNDTIIGSLTISSDILSPAIKVLGKWLREPFGNGDQTASWLALNLYILRYLQSNNVLTKEVEATALKNMEIGYQGILLFSHKDGSFSRFRGPDNQVSRTFLTAFVVRTLRLMKDYMAIDNDLIDKAVDWLVKHQNPNGCFDSGRYFLGLTFQGADNDKGNQTTTLTSFVVTSLAETKIEVNPNVFSKAKECILRGDRSDNYTMAISAYALALMNMPELADENIKTLLEAAVVENDTLSWKQKKSEWYIGPQNLEIAGYALLALLQRGTPEYRAYARSVDLSLQTRISSLGGYHSMQDSLVALDGMTRFVSIMKTKKPNLNIEISTKQNGKHNTQIKKGSRDEKEEIPLVRYPESVSFKVKGSGCILGRATVKFNVGEKPKSGIRTI